MPAIDMNVVTADSFTVDALSTSERLVRATSPALSGDRAANFLLILVGYGESFFVLVVPTRSTKATFAARDDIVASSKLQLCINTKGRVTSVFTDSTQYLVNCGTSFGPSTDSQ